ncbi:MAG TPA: guanylate cyclase [Bacteroidales bacterium]|nr:guanylate cyclase [Bacteroidales bacterium]
MVFCRSLKTTFIITLILPVFYLAGNAMAVEVIPALKGIILNGDSVMNIAYGYQGKAEITVNKKYNNITFELAESDSLVYMFFLEGFDRQWSQWLNRGYKEYTNLPAGKYKLRIRYTDLKSSAGEEHLADLKVLPIWYFSPVALIMVTILTALLIWTIYSFLYLRFARTQYMLEQIISKRTEDLIIEKEKTEDLLANVLPKNTASEIMETGKATKVKYNFVTVLFSDIQGFTKLAEEMNPEVLIDELDKFFFYFDSVVDKLGIEKIKTIGDAYMCAGGIPERNRTNPVEVILAALEMQAYMTRLKEASREAGMQLWDIRTGIHTGTVVAGVVGHKKLSYDIWGDTVNTASRMESSGEPGRINISGTTYEFVKDFFICEYRGKMPVKYKGEIDMYFVNGIVPELRDDDGRPNNKFFLKIQKIKLQDIEDAIIKKFDDEAPADMYFHNSSLVKNISNQAEILATAENLPDEQFILLKLAALFLFSGFISDFDYEKHIESSLMVVEEFLPKYGFTRSDIEEIKKLIRNSRDNVQNTLTDMILHDARYDYLGRVDYIKLTDKLLKEKAEYGKTHTREEWLAMQEKLLAEHEFITESAKMLRPISSGDQSAALRSYYS